MACPPHSPTMPRTPSCTAALMRLVPAATSRTSALPPSWWKVTLGIGSLLGGATPAVVVECEIFGLVGDGSSLCSDSQRPRRIDIRKAVVSTELLEENSSNARQLRHGRSRGEIHPPSARVLRERRRPRHDGWGRRAPPHLPVGGVPGDQRARACPRRPAVHATQGARHRAHRRGSGGLAGGAAT